MKTREIRDPNEARRFLAQGLWLQRVAVPEAATVGPALRWSLELAAGGQPLPPVGIVADVAHLVLGHRREIRAGTDARDLPGWSAGLARAYEDRVLGKLDADASIARASDALARYRGRDQDRGLAFLLDQFRRRAGFGGVLLNPAIIKTVLDAPADATMAKGWESLASEGVMSSLLALYEEVIAAVRDAHDALGPEDVFELEHRTALASFGQRVALRQVLQVASVFEAAIAQERPRSSGRRREVATRILDEDTYPVGGFSSISTKGTIESLLHSQLAYIEPDERPDLFDIKYVRDELLYYARDENQFHRRRRTFLFVLDPDLVLARVKDAGLPYQRIVLALAWLVVAVRRILGWLGDESIVFEFLFARQGHAEPLAAERALLEMVFREAIANGSVVVDSISEGQLVARARARSRRSLCYVLIVATTARDFEADDVSRARLQLEGPRPALAIEDEPPSTITAEDFLSSWSAALERLLGLWV